MPRIKRWHPISHDFNRDPEIIEARKRFGDWIGYGWIECLSIADRNDGKVPGSLDQIAELIARVSLQKYLKTAVKPAQIFLKTVAELGWIRIENTQIVIVNYGKYHRTQEQNRVPPRPDPTEPDLKEKIKIAVKPEMSVQEFVESWNECFAESLPKVEWPLAESRRKKIAVRLKEHQSLEFWKKVFSNIAASNFLLGRSNGTWKANIDWLTRNDTNCLKVYEGSYDNGKSHQVSNQGSFTQQRR